MDIIAGLSTSPIVSITIKWAEWAGMTIDRLGALMLSFCCNGNPGNLVMLLFGLKKMYPTHNVVDVWDIARMIVTKGVPTEQSFGFIWNDQKSDDGANQLDNIANW